MVSRSTADLSVFSPLFAFHYGIPRNLKYTYTPLDIKAGKTTSFCLPDPQDLLATHPAAQIRLSALYTQITLMGSQLLFLLPALAPFQSSLHNDSDIPDNGDCIASGHFLV